MNYIHVVVIGAAMLGLSCTPRSESSENQKPNIIVMMVDDMGFSDPGCYGGEVQTPNLDRLANNGLRFTRFYNCSRCSPTRASLLTGQYAHKVGLHRNGRNLSKNAATIAEVLSDNGYHTGMLGKWHLSKSLKLNGNNEDHLKWLNHQIETDEMFGPDGTYPVDRGFDKHYGVIWGVVNFFDPFSLVNGKEPVETVPNDYYITDAISDSAVAYINEFSADEDPFFLYVAHTAPHWPLHALDEDIAIYDGMYDEGWDALRKKRFERQVEMGLFPADITLPEVMGGDWSALSDKEKTFQIAKMEAHAAMVHRVDVGLGKIVDALKANGQFDNTIIMFLSDNGASPETPTKPGYDRNSETRDGKIVIYEGMKYMSYVGPDTTYTGMGRPWSNAANTPYRYWKKQSFEGGNNTPFVLHWPKGLTADAGSIVRQPAHVIDVLPTCLDIIGVEYPQMRNDKPVTQPDGKSLLPIIEGGEREGHEYLFFEHECGRAVHKGDWKLVSLTTSHRHWNEFKDWELYNLKEDRTELDNVIEQNPELAQELKDAWNNWWNDYKNLEVSTINGKKVK